MTHPAPTPRHRLADPHQRAAAGRMIDDSSGGYVVDGTFVADILDANAAAVLQAAGVSRDDARAVLQLLWSPPGPGQPRAVTRSG